MGRLGLGYRILFGAGLLGLGLGMLAVRRPAWPLPEQSIHAQEQAPGRREFQLTARRYEYAPPRIEVTQDDLVKITLTSGDIPHSFTIDEYRIAKRVGAGQTVSFEFRADQPGTFRIYCNLRQDEKCRDMRATLVVTPR
jgi:heme/copper-type cytochrome/quinol oxidase subunit 2